MEMASSWGWPELNRRIATVQAVKSDILRNSQAVASTAKGATGAKEKQRENLRIFLRFCFCFSFAPVASFAVDAGFSLTQLPHADISAAVAQGQQFTVG